MTEATHEPTQESKGIQSERQGASGATTVEEPSLKDADANNNEGQSKALGDRRESLMRHRVAEKLSKVASAVKPGVDTSFDSARRTIATRLEGAARSIDHANAAEIRRNAGAFAKRHPFGILAVGVGVGWLTGRALKGRHPPR